MIKSKKVRCAVHIARTELSKINSIFRSENMNESDKLRAVILDVKIIFKWILIK